jgi:hypothetical protein
MSARSEVYTQVDLDPADLAHQTHALARYLGELAIHEKNKVVSGGIATDPTTPSSQLTGTGNTTWNVNHSLVEALVEGVLAELAAGDDLAIHSGSYLTGFANGTSCVAALVVKNDSGTLSVASVKGTPATTGSQKPPTDAEIQTALGAGVSWIRLADLTINRTGDTTVTESQNNQVRPLLGMTVATGFGTFTG